jgi:hypothetical protein
MKALIILKIFAIVAVVTACFSSCIHDTPEYRPSAEKEITFVVSVSTTGDAATRSESGNNRGKTAPSTRAITETGAEDNRVDEIVILLFGATAPYTYIDLIQVPETAIVDDAGNIFKKRFKALIPGGSYKTLLLANSSD